MQLADGLVLEKTSCPLGVLLIVFESRPDALVQVIHTILVNVILQFIYRMLSFGETISI